MAQDNGSDDVPLRRVVLFTSGVGFFEHTGTVQDDARIELKFNVEDINDLLKSMVVQDLGGGRISTVSYGSRDPITRTLKTFAIDLTENPSLAELLNQVRGEKLEVEAPNAIQGTLIGVEKRIRKVKAGDDEETVEYHVLNLLTDEGLRSVSLENVSRVKLLNEKLDAELRQALAVLATGNATDKKTVALEFSGQGRRQVRVGYIQETPVWKTSYRLVLQEDEPPFLQGWAIVENTTETDWNDVSLTLVSGRPVSFRMDLYTPLYVDRPLVVPELFASLLPPTYAQDLASAEEQFRKMANLARDKQKADAKARRELAARGRFEGRANARPAPGAPAEKLYDDRVAELEEMDMLASVRSLAQAEDVGELFQYKIETPVTLGRQRSAMLPIVNAPVEGKKVSIYNAAVHAKHPLNGLRLTNSTDLHLMQGPITVFDAGAYAGDARIEDLPPKSTRLISYAMDLDTEVAPTSKAEPQRLVGVKIVKGTMYASYRYQRTQSYTVKNSGKKTKTVLIEYPFDPQWKLVEPKKPAERTRDLYRFAVEAEPGVPAELKIVEERTQSQTVYLTNADVGQIRIFLSAPVVGDKVKEALREVIRRRAEISQLARERGLLEQKIQVIAKEQDRIRQNMAQLDRTTDLYNRYVKKFGEQEDQIESLREQIDRLRDEEAEKQEALDEFLIGLNVE